MDSPQNSVFCFEKEMIKLTLIKLKINMLKSFLGNFYGSANRNCQCFNSAVLHVQMQITESTFFFR